MLTKEQALELSEDIRLGIPQIPQDCNPIFISLEGKIDTSYKTKYIKRDKLRFKRRPCKITQRKPLFPKYGKSYSGYEDNWINFLKWKKLR